MVEELISIIIVNYNGKKWLKKLFDSLQCQTYKNFEIIFVDNASSDDSVEFIKNNYNDDRIKIIQSEKNLGFAGGNNSGAKNAEGDYLLFINTDVWIEPDFLQKLLYFYNDHDYDVVGPLEANYFSRKKCAPYVSTIDFFGHSIYLSAEKYVKCQSFYLTGVCFLVSSKLYQESLGLDKNFFMYSEEVDWFWRLELMGKTCAYACDIFVYHAGSGSTGKGLRYTTFLWRNQNTLQMLQKNYKWFNLLWVLPIYFIQNIFEIIFFVVILKPKIAFSYIQGWQFNIVNFKKIMEKRKWVQENRLVGDYEIIKKMYLGFGKLHHLINFYKK